MEFRLPLDMMQCARSMPTYFRAFTDETICCRVVRLSPAEEANHSPHGLHFVQSTRFAYSPITSQSIVGVTRFDGCSGAWQKGLWFCGRLNSSEASFLCGFARPTTLAGHQDTNRTANRFRILHLAGNFPG